MSNPSLGFEQALALYRGRRPEEAEWVCREVLNRQPHQVQVLHLLGLILADRGKTTEAFDCLEQALKLDRQNPALLGAYALMLFRNLRLEEAENAARAALALQPELADVLDILGSIHWRRGDVLAARDCFERALRQSPEHPGAWGNLALLAEQSNRVEEAERMAEEGLARRPQDVTLRLVRGRCLRRRGEFTEARKLFDGLRDAGTPALRRDVEYELATCADALGEAESGFVHAEHANRLARQLAPQALKDARYFMAQIHGLRARFSSEWVAAWRPFPGEDGITTPAFLVGFPRSGTTLMDSMLGAYPDIKVLEEHATERAMVGILNGLPGQYPDALRDLTVEQRAAVTQAYFRAAGPEAEQRKQLLDKSPFMTVHLGLVQRIFAGARIVFMARHPCDVVWSCFMTNMELNSGSAHFTRLNSTVDLYCSVMTLWQRYCEVLPLNCHRVRYEDLLEMPETVLRAVLTFLDLPWSDQVLHHAEHVAARGKINSASYAQVSRPLYQTSRDRWRCYQKYLEPYLPRLQPWCEFFGYSV